MKQKDVFHVIGLLLYLSLAIAVPVSRRTRDTFQGNSSSLASDECVSEDIIYKAGDIVPSPGPCEQCLCQPPKVECTMIKCKTNSGCKMIQRANHCCPDYLCECEYKGREYNNGERLELEDAPCQVCYCKGGEIMCTSITCYERTDCEPKYDPGKCCPRYDHCPLEKNENNSGNSTVIGSKREIQPWLMTNAVTVKPIDVLKQTTLRPPEDHTPPNVYPQTLKIHEILPTTAKYERFPNGKRPVLSTVSKVPQEVHLNEKVTSNLESSTVVNGEIVSTESLLTTISEEEKHSSSQFSMSTLNPATTITDESSFPTTIISNPKGSMADKASGNLGYSGIPFELATTNAEFMTTEYSQPDFNYAPIPKDDGLAEEIESKENLVNFGSTVTETETTESPEWESISATGSDSPFTKDNQPSTESVQIRDVSSEGGFFNDLVTKDGLNPTIETLLTTFDEQDGNPAFESISENIETIDPTSSSFTQQMEPLMLEGGVYDELNDTLIYSDDNFVKQDENIENGDKELSVTTTSAENTSYSKQEYDPSMSALSEVFEKFVDSPRSDSSSIRRSDDWLSDNYQMFPEDGAEDSDDSLLDLNVGATSHSDTRVSPAYYFGSDSKESYVLNGRSLAPSTEESSKENLYPGKDVSEANKFNSNLNRIVTEKSLFHEKSQTLESKLVDAISIKLNPGEESDLYLSITGKNSSSNETILHMILSPSDLKHLAEQLVKENIKSHRESELKETEVKLEWLTKEQLSQINHGNTPSTFNVNLAKCNFTALKDLKLEKVTVGNSGNVEFNSSQSDISIINSEIRDNSSESDSSIETEQSEETSNSSEEITYSTTPSYHSNDESADLQNSAESVTTNDNNNISTSATPRSKKQNIDIETSTIKIYEIRPTSGLSDKPTESPETTDGPYTSDKMPVTSEFQPSQSYLPDNTEITKVSSSNDENTTENDFETSTLNSRPSEKSRKKNLPNVEPFLRQLPSTLDEKDVSILRDFLEKHLSEPHER